MINVYEEQDRNKRASFLVILVFCIFVIGTSWLIAKAMGYGPGTIGVGLILSGIMSFASYWWSDKIILGFSGARMADKTRDFNFFTVAENLSMAAQIPMPKLYVIEDTAMNAFATGRDPQHAVVCVTSGILTRLNRTELEGVVAHELSHVRNYDTRLMSIVTILVGLVTLLGDWFLRGFRVRRKNDDEGGQLQVILFVLGLIMALLSPVIARLIQLAVSRQREYSADATGVFLTRYPAGLASALKKLEADTEPLEVANKATAHLYITNPLKNHRGQIGRFANLFNTHPPIEQRIKRLEAMK
jgi:heat shock protein HtpX